MSVAASQPRHRALKLKAILPWVGLGLVALLLLANLLYLTVVHGRSVQASSAPMQAPPAEAPPVPATTVRLPEGKFKSAGIATATAHVESMPSEVGVAGRID